MEAAVFHRKTLFASSLHDYFWKMASSFQDFPAENFASCSPDDSHLVLETIFSYFYFSTRSWRAPAIYVVDISLLLSPLGRSSTRQLLGAEPAHHSSFCVFHTAKPEHSWGWQQQFLSSWRWIIESKQAKENQIHSSSSECLQGHSQAGLGKGLMIWTLKAQSCSKYRGSCVQLSNKKHEKIAATCLG